MHTRLPSNKKFGFLMTAVFFLIAFYFYYKNLNLYFYPSAAISILFLLITLINHSLLTKLNKFWLLFGECLGKVVSPIILGIIFFFLISPVAIIVRIFGRDELRIKRVLSIKSYWILIDKKGSKNKSFSDQF